MFSLRRKLSGSASHLLFSARIDGLCVCSFQQCQTLLTKATSSRRTLATSPACSTSIKGPSSSIASDGGLSPSVDYDLIVLGGGSGGLSCAKEASDLGANVCLLDFVEPSPRGTKWGLGGTCVNVGCIPKKLMHTAALLGDSLEDARHYGWNVPEGITHDWGKLVQAITMHIRSLTWGYRVQLKTNAVTYMNAIGTFVDSKTIKATDAKGKEKVISANNIVVAVGGRPIYPDDIPGARDIAISSDDIFTLREPPGRTLVIGASYVALECAGFLQGLGYPTSLLIRSIPLRGFDRQMANLVLQDLSSRGTEVIKGVPVSMKRNGSGKAEVTIQLKDGTESVCTYDTVMLATGRRSVAGALGLKEAGVELDEDSGKVIGQDGGEETNVPGMYAIGDTLHDRLELQPVAAKAGKYLARRMFSNSTLKMDYSQVPTTVFTPLEYASVGLSEDSAMQKYGEDNIEVYHAFYKPLEFYLPQRDSSRCYIKMICDREVPQRAFGLHITGPNAGEIMQGFAVAFKLGLSKASLEKACGIHPTVAEEITKLNITKRSGRDPVLTGC